MPLQKIQLRPGVNREGTTLANEGGYFDGDKIRFRSGFPEKIGGWTNAAVGTFLGVARSLWNWITLKGFNLLGVGTNLKFYVQEDGGAFYDITPIRFTSDAGAATFAATTGSPTITVTNATGAGFQTGDFVTFSGAVSLGGNITAAILNQEYQITYVSSTTFTIQARVVSSITTPGAAVNANASDVGNGGGSTVAAYQISTGQAVYTVGTGWGAGPWNAGSAGDAWAHGWGTGYSTGIGLQLRLWSQSNFGERLLFSPRGGALYVWDPLTGTQPAYTTRGTLISGTDVPAFVNEVLLSDATRIVICFGCNDYGAYGSTSLEPMLIRWSAQESYTNWTPSISNQAGSYRLSHGSTIVGSLQTRQEIVVWTDSAVYAMQYLGPPYVWGFTLLADNTSIVSMNAMATAGGVIYWMGSDKFYIYSGRVETLPCSVRTYVYDNINTSQYAQIFAGTNEGFSEVWWFYCSSGATSPDRYVIFNYLDRVWYYGTLDRTAWNDSALRVLPQATTSGNLLVNHESGADDGTTDPASPISSFCQSSDFDIDDGHNYGFVWRMIPDITFDGSTTAAPNFPSVNLQLLPRQNPGAAYGAANTPLVVTPQSYATQRYYTVQQFTEIVYTRVRGRQMSFKVLSSALGVQWQLGVPRIDIRPDGKR
jgi:hypothetical protein